MMNEKRFFDFSKISTDEQLYLWRQSGGSVSAMSTTRAMNYLSSYGYQLWYIDGEHYQLRRRGDEVVADAMKWADLDKAIKERLEEERKAEYVEHVKKELAQEENLQFPPENV